jgi:acid phosphatase type 7
MHVTSRHPLRLLILLSPLLIAPLYPAPAELAPTITPIELDASWHYYDKKEAPDDSWQTPGFDHATWPEGNGLLGYKTGEEAPRWPAPGLTTKMAEKHITYLFRTTFSFDGEPSRVRLVIDHVIDDAAIFYLNGKEIGRTGGLPNGPVAFGQRATSTTNPTLATRALVIEDAPLVNGENTLAASVHNQSANSSDICFGLRLTIEDRRAASPPPGLILTYAGDPTTSITIDYHRLATQLEDPPQIHWRPSGEDDWRTAEASRFDFPFSDRKVDRVTLSHLKPDSNYEFRASPFSPIYSFQTLPANLDRPVRLAIGGDTMHARSDFEAMNRAAMAHAPDLIVWGGDLAYADGNPSKIDRWYDWFAAVVETTIHPDGRVTPIVVGIGNHEVQGGYIKDREVSDRSRRDIAPFYYSLFAFPGQPGYAALDIGDYLSLVLVDTDHSNPVVGAQTEWLAETLAERASRPFLIPIYHVPAYPSHRDFNGSTSRAIREHWLPLFEKHNIHVAFENHDHTFKRTVPIRDGKEDPSGVTYLGDGSWGVGVRPVHDPERTWYLEHALSVHHGFIVTFTIEGQHIIAIDPTGKVLDELSFPARQPE